MIILTDGEIAKAALMKGNAVVVAKDGAVVLTRTGRGIRPLYEIVSNPEYGSLLAGAAVADKVVGKAAALLCAAARVKEVYAALLSEPAANVLAAKAIPFACGEKVPLVLNRTRTDICPIEKLAASIDTPAILLEAVAKFLARME
jgi:hypothetical protein